MLYCKSKRKASMCKKAHLLWVVLFVIIFFHKHPQKSRLLKMTQMTIKALICSNDPSMSSYPYKKKFREFSLIKDMCNTKS